MKKFYRLFTFCILPSFLLATPSVAKEKFYVGASYGIGIANKFDYYKDEGMAMVRPKNSQLFGLSLGYKLNDNIRTELALNHFNKFEYKNTIRSYDNATKALVSEDYYNQIISANAIFANLYFDTSKFGEFKPYVNIGLGVSRNKAGDLEVKEEGKDANGNSFKIEDVHASGTAKSKFAWNVGAGLSYEVNKKLTLDLISYKYYDLGKISTGPDSDGDYLKVRLKIHGINTGIRLKF